MHKNKTKSSKESNCLTNNQKETFKKTKAEMCEITFRHQLDSNEEMIFTRDASDRAIGAILSQKDSNGNRMMLRAFSKDLERQEGLFHCRQRTSCTSKVY